MSNYARFVSYLYEYKDGAKSENRGYVKVEARDNLGKIELHIKTPGQPDNASLKVYGFIRKDSRLPCILLGSCNSIRNTALCKLQFSTENIGGTGYDFADLCGLLIFCEDSVCYGTSWDDHPIIVNTYDDISSAPAQTMTDSQPLPPEEPEAPALEPPAPEPPAPEPPAPEPQLAPEQLDVLPDLDEPKEVVPTAEIEPLFTQSDPIIESEALSAGGEAIQDESLADKDLFEAKLELTRDQQFSGNNMFRDEQYYPSQIPSPTEELLNSQAWETVGESYRQQYFQPAPEESLSASPVPPASGSTEHWQKLCENHANISPFQDDEIGECLQLELSDLQNPDHNNWGIGDNQFLLHGYSKYQHLLLGKTKRCGKTVFILGVPGIYDANEQNKADTFGFPYFKTARKKCCENGDFGYWYRLIN